MVNRLTFISAPYGNAPDQEERIKQITKYGAECMKRGHQVICPMTLGLAFTKFAELPNTTEWWMEWTLNLLSRCDSMIVLCFPGWEESIGVKQEIEFASKKGIEVIYQSALTKF